jgi:molybdenum cofactor cytidylyltransferase
MRYGSFSLADALGVILAHGIKHAKGLFKKGRVLTKDDIELLAAAGKETVTGVKLDSGDVPEDVAARKVALAACGSGVRAQEAFTGRANLHADVHGIVMLDDPRIRAINHLHESLTLATLSRHSVVRQKQMVATIKVIPFAVPSEVLDKALAIIGDKPLVHVAAFQNKMAGLIITKLPQTKPSIVEKSESSIRDRLSAIGASLAHVMVCDHDQTSVSAAIARLSQEGCDPILLFGASAIVDRSDVLPAGLVAAGGQVVHLGMPVDPGNLLMLGNIKGANVIGVPSCARSPKVNGFDWVLERIIAGVSVSREDIMDMGAGGLLAEIGSRPQPREPGTQSAPRIAAIVLAAGKSTRMGANKMVAEFRGKPLVQATVASILTSSVDEVVVVTGHESEKVQSALANLNVRLVHNPDFEVGLASSLGAGIRAVAGRFDAAIICLADMPLVEAKMIDRLIAAFNPIESRNIIAPTCKGKMGNPVLWGAQHFSHLMGLSGDKGARHLIDEFRSEVVEVEADTDAVLRDADTAEMLAQMQDS